MKKILSLLVFALISVSLWANNDLENEQMVYQKGKTNWFISADGSANIYVGQQDNQIDFLRRIGWGGSLHFGKWFTPCVGFKVGLNISNYYGAALSGEAANFRHEGEYWAQEYSRYNLDNLQKQSFLAFNPNFDIMFSLFNSLGKIKDNRVYDMVLHLGAGVFVNNGANICEKLNYGNRRIIVSPSVNFGLQQKFRLSKQVDFNINMSGAWVSDFFDGQTVSNGKYEEGDIVASLGVGLTYKFKPRGVKRVTVVPDNSAELQEYAAKCRALQQQCDSVALVNAALQQQIDDLKKMQEPQIQVVQVKEPNNTRVVAILEYEIGASELNKANRQKLKAVADEIKANPTAAFEICGYADNETGSKNINIRLRNARANRAIDQLLHYGVNRNQLLKSTNDGDLPGITTRAVIIRQLDCD